MSDKRTLANAIGFALGHTFGEGVWIASCVDRSDLGMATNKRPGDIALLLLPEVSGELHIERAVAIEAKVVRPTFERPDKNANSLGATQALGLLDEGFPLVGLLHITAPGPLPADLHVNVPHITGVDAESNPFATGEGYIVDPFPVYSAERQLGRLEGLGLPETVGYAAIGLTLSKDGEGIAGNTIGYERAAQPNPDASFALLQRLAKWAANRPEVFTKVQWYGTRAS